MSATSYAANIDRQLITGRERMELLCESFPALRGRPGTSPWDQEKFAHAMSGGQSTSEKLAAAFVLSVWSNESSTGKAQPWWNERPFRVGRFDFITAMGVWDALNRQAFINWCQRPFWP